MQTPVSVTSSRVGAIVTGPPAQSSTTGAACAGQVAATSAAEAARAEAAATATRDRTGVMGFMDAMLPVAPDRETDGAKSRQLGRTAGVEQSGWPSRRGRLGWCPSCGSRTDPTRVRGGAPVRPQARRVLLLIPRRTCACQRPTTLPAPRRRPSRRSSSAVCRCPTPTAPSCPASTCSPSPAGASGWSARTAPASRRCCVPSPGGCPHARRSPGPSRPPTTSSCSARSRRSATAPRSPRCSR